MDARGSSSFRGTSTTRQQSPQLAWPPADEEVRRSRRSVPPVVQQSSFADESFTSTTDRRRLVADLRAQVRQQQQKTPSSSSSFSSAKRPLSSEASSSSSPYALPQQQQQQPPAQPQRSSFPRLQQRQQQQHQTPPSQQLTTEEIAARELADLERTTSGLRKLQTGFQDMALLLQRDEPYLASPTAAAPKPGASSSSWGEQGGGRTPSGRYSIPKSTTPLVPVVVVAAPQQQQPQQQQPEVSFAPQQFHTPPAQHHPHQQQQYAQPPPPPPPQQYPYYMYPQYAPQPQYFAPPPPQFYHPHPSPYAYSPYAPPPAAMYQQQQQPPPPQSVPVTAAPPVVEQPVPVVVAAAAAGSVSPIAPLAFVTQTPPPQPASAPVEEEATRAVPAAVVDIPVASSGPAFVAPAHVSTNELEEEVAKRRLATAAADVVPAAAAVAAIVVESAPPPVVFIAPQEQQQPEESEGTRKRQEILAKRRAAAAAAAAADEAAQAAPEPQPQQTEKEEEEAEEAERATRSRRLSATMPHRAVVIVPPPPDSPKIGVAKTLHVSTASDVVLEKQQPEPVAAAAASTTESPEDRAARYARLLSQAERAPEATTTNNSQPLVLFGTYLKSGLASSSYDDADMRQAKPKRPPTVLGGSSASSSPSLSTPGSPAAEPTPLQERQPVQREGVLMKTSGKSSFMGLAAPKWQERWFILSGRLLLYTSRQGSRDVKRMIDLESIDVVTDPRTLSTYMSAPTVHCIGILEHGEPRMLVLCARTYGEILDWYKAIVLNVALLCQVNRRPALTKPPADRSERLSPEEAKRRFLQAQSQKFIDELPPTPPPQLEWFYPAWQKPKSYYDLLGVPPDATSGMIKKAYYKIARESHPDRSNRNMDTAGSNASSPALPGSPLSTSDFADIAQAYETLIEEAKRSEYDLGERIKEELRNGIDVTYLEPIWRDADLTIEPRLRQIRNCAVRRVTIFCDGELRCLYWQPAAAAAVVAPAPAPTADDADSATDGEGEEEGSGEKTPASPLQAAPAAAAEPEVLLPLMPTQERCFEMRFVQQILYFRDGPVDLGDNEPPPYEGEKKLFILGDRLHCGPFLLQLDSDKQCSDLLRGLRIARCEKSTLFKQKMDANACEGVL